MNLWTRVESGGVTEKGVFHVLETGFQIPDLRGKSTSIAGHLGVYGRILEYASS